jgi:hypothetical protein
MYSKKKHIATHTYIYIYILYLLLVLHIYNIFSTYAQRVPHIIHYTLRGLIIGVGTRDTNTYYIIIILYSLSASNNSCSLFGSPTLFIIKLIYCIGTSVADPPPRRILYTVYAYIMYLQTCMCI